MAKSSFRQRNEMRYTIRKSNKVSVNSGGVPAFDQVAPTAQFILDACDITYLSNRVSPRELAHAHKLGAQEAKAGIPSCDADGVFTSPYTTAQYDVYLSDCHINERYYLARQVITQYGENRQGSVKESGVGSTSPRENVSGTAAEARARARMAAREKSAADAALRDVKEEALMCDAAGKANIEILSHAFDRAKSINLELANAYIAGAVEADARMKVLARWLPLPWLRVRASRSRIDDAGAPLAHVNWPNYQSQSAVLTQA